MKINSRAKGKSGERELINQLKHRLPAEMGVQLERNLEQTRNGGHDILGLPGWALEVKRYAQVTPADLKSFWQQAVDQARRDQSRPALAFREDRRDWRVVLRLSDVSATWPTEDDYDYTVQVSLELFSLIVSGERDDVQEP